MMRISVFTQKDIEEVVIINSLNILKKIAALLMRGKAINFKPQ
jgi:hypothetical protein